MPDLTLRTEVQFVKGIGPKNGLALAKLDIRTVEDLLFTMPRRYEDRRNLPRICDVIPGQFAALRGRISAVESRPTARGMVIIRAVIRDGTGSIALTWFNQPWLYKLLRDQKSELIAYGQIKEGSRSLEIASPEWELVDEEEEPEDFGRIVPIYRLTEGLPQRAIRRGARAALEQCLEQITEVLPKAILVEQSLPGIRWAIQQIHSPDSEENRQRARSRLVFDEFFFLQTALAMRRAETQQELGIAFPIDDLLDGRKPERPVYRLEVREKAAVQPLTDAKVHLFEDEFTAGLHSSPLLAQIAQMLPFQLTAAQSRVISEVFTDMREPFPMNRLVQGDVGSGKTAVAAACILAAIRSGYQAVLMAPTEILAEQHFATLNRLFKPMGVEVELLIGKLGSRAKQAANARIESGLAHIVVGTHAIIQDGVKFARLGFVVIDEQHRFGVLQRVALREKGLGNPDVLVMTATPIPRTLTMIVYGDLDVSVIDELPPGRRPVKTHHRAATERDTVYAAVRKLLLEGRQAFFVCPMVAESEKVQAKAAELLHSTLSIEVFPDFRVGLLHGQMKAAEKEATMDAFRRHELDVLVATTVIEVGVDVPNASVMVIEDANRFGLSQLHQLRGRVGRGAHQSFCILIGDNVGEDARARLDIMVATTDGFAIAEEDLRLRGPGELAGTRQSGALDFKYADLAQDGRMLEVSRQAAIKLVHADPRLENADNSLLASRVLERRTNLATITVS